MGNSRTHLCAGSPLRGLVDSVNSLSPYDSTMIPKTLPRATLAEIEKVIRANKSQIRDDDSVILVTIRGYYLRSMGDPTRNDRNLYDDAAFIVSPTHFSSWNFNVDPSVHRAGVASLIEGVHRYKPGLHGVSFKRSGYPYPAFIPAAPGKRVPVRRDGQKGIQTGVALNIHKGSRTTTSSLGCLTVPPNQWDGFFHALTDQLKRHNQKDFPVILKTNS